MRKERKGTRLGSRQKMGKKRAWVQSVSISVTLYSVRSLPERGGGDVGFGGGGAGFGAAQPAAGGEPVFSAFDAASIQKD